MRRTGVDVWNSPRNPHQRPCNSAPPSPFGRPLRRAARIPPYNQSPTFCFWGRFPDSSESSDIQMRGARSNRLAPRSGASRIRGVHIRLKCSEFADCSMPITGPHHFSWVEICGFRRALRVRPGGNPGLTGRRRESAAPASAAYIFGDMCGIRRAFRSNAHLTGRPRSADH